MGTSGAAQFFQRARDQAGPFDGVHVGLQPTAAALVPGSNQPISFAGKERDYGRDVVSLSGIAAVVWLEGINDFSKNGHTLVEAVEAGMKDVVGRIRAKFAGVRIIGAIGARQYQRQS